MPTNRVTLPRLRPATRLPHLEPVGLIPRTEPFDDPAWAFEPKYEGFRGLAYASPGACEIRSRRDIPLERFSSLWIRMAEVLGSREVILDGEIVALDRQGRPDFQELIRGQGFLAYAACDLLWLDGTDLRTRPLSERKELLGDVLPEDTGPLYKILTVQEHGRALFAAIRKMDLKGIVAKRMTEPYATDTTWYMITNPAYTPRRRGGPFSEPPAGRARYSGKLEPTRH